MTIQIDKTRLTELLNKLFEDSLPNFGLDWRMAERIARLYKFLEEVEASQRYFNLAAKLNHEQLILLEQRPDVRKIELVESYIHFALLYYYAKGENSKNTLEDVNARTVVTLRSYNNLTSLRFDQFHLLIRAIPLCLMRGDTETVRQYLVDLKKFQSSGTAVEEESGLPITIRAIEMMLQAQVICDRALAAEAIAHLKTYIETEQIPVDTMGRVSEWDILELLRKIGDGI